MLFCLTANYTPAALNAMMANPSNREEAAARLVEAAGGKLVALYRTIAEGPGVMAIIDVEPVAAPAITGVVTSAGTFQNVKLQRLFTHDEIVAVRQKAAAIRGTYKAPGQ